MRYQYHCAIIDLIEDKDNYTFRFVECLSFPDSIMDIAVGKYNNYVMLWSADKNLYLWDEKSLRTIYKTSIPQFSSKNFKYCYSMYTYSILEVAPLQIQTKNIISEAGTMKIFFPEYAPCLCSFTAHPRVAITTQGNNIFSLDFRVCISIISNIYQKFTIIVRKKYLINVLCSLLILENIKIILI